MYSISGAGADSDATGEPNVVFVGTPENIFPEGELLNTKRLEPMKVKLSRTTHTHEATKKKCCWSTCLLCLLVCCCFGHREDQLTTHWERMCSVSSLTPQSINILTQVFVLKVCHLSVTFFAVTSEEKRFLGVCVPTL